MERFFWLLALLIGFGYGTSAQSQYGDLIRGGFDCQVPFDHQLIKSGAVRCIVVDRGLQFFFDTTGFVYAEIPGTTDTVYWQRITTADTIVDTDIYGDKFFDILGDNGRLVKSGGVVSGRQWYGKSYTYMHLYFYSSGGMLDSALELSADKPVVDLYDEKLFREKGYFRKYLYVGRSLERIINYGAGEVLSQFVFKLNKHGLPISMTGVYPGENNRIKLHSFKYYYTKR